MEFCNPLNNKKKFETILCIFLIFSMTRSSIPRYDEETKAKDNPKVILMLTQEIYGRRRGIQ